MQEVQNNRVEIVNAIFRVCLTCTILLSGLGSAWSASEFSASVELDTSNKDITCENVDDDIAEIVEQMDDLGYSVISGQFELYEPGKNGFYLPFARPDSVYLISLFEDGLQYSYRLGGRDVIVWRGCTPPETDSFRTSMHVYNHRRVLTMENFIPTSTLDLQASLNDPLLLKEGEFNTEENLDTSHASPYDRKTNVVITADMNTFNDVRNAYINADLYENNTLNFLAIDPSSFIFSESELDTPRDEVTVVLQIDKLKPYHQEAFDLHAHRPHWKYLPTPQDLFLPKGQSYPFRLFYKDETTAVTPATVELRDTTPTPAQVQQAADLQAPFNDLVDEVVAYFQNQDYTLLSDTPFTTNGATVAGQSLFSGEHGQACVSKGESCQYDVNIDASWSDQNAHELSNQDLYVVVGLNHAQLGMAEFGSYLGMYHLANNDNNLQEIARWRSVDFPWPSAYDVISNGYSPDPLVRTVGKQSFITHLTRPDKCAASSDKSASTFVCFTTDELALTDSFIFRGSVSLNPETNTRPDESQLVPWRLLWFTK